MKRSYTFRVFQYKVPKHEPTCSYYTSAGHCDGKTCVQYGDHTELGTYDNLEHPPWVPPVGSFFRFRDPHPPGQEVNHEETAAVVKEVVTCFYGTSTTIEVYLRPNKTEG